MEFLGSVFELFGSVMIGFAALRVHHRVLNEHKMDQKVFKIMKREQYVGILGVIFLIIGFLVKWAVPLLYKV